MELKSGSCSYAGIPSHAYRWSHSGKSALGQGSMGFEDRALGEPDLEVRRAGSQRALGAASQPTSLDLGRYPLHLIMRSTFRKKTGALGEARLWPERYPLTW